MSEARKATMPPISSGLGQALESLQAKREVPARVRPDEIRHVGQDGTRSDRIDADAAWAEHGGEMLHQRIERSLGRHVGRERPNGGTRGQRRDELLPSHMIGSSC
jgi:hypothetical protein